MQVELEAAFRKQKTITTDLMNTRTELMYLNDSLRYASTPSFNFWDYFFPKAYGVTVNVDQTQILIKVYRKLIKNTKKRLLKSKKYWAKYYNKKLKEKVPAPHQCLCNFSVNFHGDKFCHAIP